MSETKLVSDILTLSEAAALIRVSERTLGELARMRRVPSRKVGREWRFLRPALEAWLAGEAGSIAKRNAAVSGRGGAGPRQYELLLPAAGLGDTAFAENHDRALHRWVPWIAGFSGSFVAGVLDSVRSPRRRLRVLDPFAGVGTTLIEALKEGDDAIGYEINPYAAMACRVKINAAQYDASMVEEVIAALEEYDEEESWLNGVQSSIPAGFRSRIPFFSPAVERQVLACMDFISQQRSDWVRDLLQVAFGSVMVGFSNYTYEPSLGTRAGAGKPAVENADVFGVVRRKLRDMHEDIVTFQTWMAKYDKLPRAAVHPLSYLDHSDRTEPGSVDALITSPPYLNNYHYVRNTRPHLFWLGMVRHAAELKQIEQHSFGQFWQTVRYGPAISLRADLPYLARQLEELRSRNTDKGAYGGPGWANYAAAYFNDCQRFCAATLPLMRSGGTVVVVIGNNILQGIEFRTDRLFAEIAEREGFRIVDLHEVRKKRIGTSIVNSAVRSGTVSRQIRLYETAVELRVP